VPKPHPRTRPGRTPRADSPARRHHGPAAAAGWTAKQPKTAANHVEHIYAKLGVSSRAAATLYAAQYGLMGTFASAKP
jgi:hypothetical protein